MQYILGLPTDHVESIDDFGTGPAIAEIASAAEKLGYAGVFVTDHPAPPKSFIDAGGHHTLDPLIALAAAAVSTAKLKILTNLYIAAYRNPLLAAKSVATLDNLSQGRLILGVGAGYLEGEFKAAGVDYQTRGELLNEHLEIITQAWTGNPISASTSQYEAEDIISLPTPFQRSDSSTIPIWVGGNSKNAMQRTARFGEGWIPMPTPKGMERFVKTSAITDVKSLSKKIDDLSGIWESHGRNDKPSIAIEPWDAGRLGTDDWEFHKYQTRLEEFSQMGVTHIPVMLSSIGREFDRSRSEFIDLISEYAQMAGI